MEFSSSLGRRREKASSNERLRGRRVGGEKSFIYFMEQVYIYIYIHTHTYIYRNAANFAIWWPNQPVRQVASNFVAAQQRRYACENGRFNCLNVTAESVYSVYSRSGNTQPLSNQTFSNLSFAFIFSFHVHTYIACTARSRIDSQCNECATGIPSVCL